MGFPWCSTSFASAFGNGTIFLDIKLFIKCGRRAIESYVVLGGSLPNARLVANVMAKSLQSIPFFCCSTIRCGYLTHFPDQMNILQFNESNRAVTNYRENKLLII